MTRHLVVLPPRHAHAAQAFFRHGGTVTPSARKPPFHPQDDAAVAQVNTIRADVDNVQWLQQGKGRAR